MMKYNKKIIFLVTVSFFILIFFVIKYQSNNNPKNSIEQTNNTIKPPVINSDIEKKLDLKTENFSQSKFIFPNELPLLTITYTDIDIARAEEIKNKLGLKSETIEFNDSVEGKKYITSDNNNFLVIIPNNSTVKYGSNDENIIDNTKEILSDDDFIKKGEMFLTNNQFYEKEAVKPYKIEYLRRNEKTEGLEEAKRDEAEIFRVNYIFNNSKFKIVNNYSKNSQIFVEFNRSGEVYNSEIKLIKSLTQGIKMFNVKKYSEFIEELPNSKLIELEGDYYSTSDIKSDTDILNISISSVEIAYFDEGKGKEYLQPIFLINADIKIKDSESNKAILYLPAISNQI